MNSNVVWFADLGLADLETRSVARTPPSARWCANLARLGVRVPDGFATTADAYRRFIGDTGLAEMISARWPAWTPTTFSGSREVG